MSVVARGCFVIRRHRGISRTYGTPAENSGHPGRVFIKAGSSIIHKSDLGRLTVRRTQRPHKHSGVSRSGSMRVSPYLCVCARVRVSRIAAVSSSQRVIY